MEEVKGKVGKDRRRQAGRVYTEYNALCSSQFIQDIKRIEYNISVGLHSKYDERITMTITIGGRLKGYTISMHNCMMGIVQLIFLALTIY